MKFNFSFYRLWAIIVKEFIQIKRDRLTLGMMIGIPVMQLILFGFAINTNPRHLPTAVISAENTIYTRTFLKAMQNTKYFKFDYLLKHETQAKTLLDLGKVLFVVTIPPQFSHDLIKGNNPAILVEADATDPVATNAASSAMQILVNGVFDQVLAGPVSNLQSKSQPFEFIIHAKYNPEAITQYNIVPGLLGVILTMTMVIITALALTRERERGTIENLLAMPVLPLEVMIGKIFPYITIGYVQVILTLVAAYFIFFVPIEGSLTLLILMCLPFIFANLAVGLMFSTLAKNQLQAVQSAFFFFLPSLLLSGFMFPFYGMPTWAQWLGDVFPLTHFVKITRGILLKGNNFFLLWPQLWPILLFTLVVILIGLKRFRRTLD